jgi:hypothetical protein
VNKEINKELLFYWLYLFTLSFIQLFFSIHLFVTCKFICLHDPANIRVYNYLCVHYFHLFDFSLICLFIVVHLMLFLRSFICTLIRSLIYSFIRFATSSFILFFIIFLNYLPISFSCSELCSAVSCGLNLFPDEALSAYLKSLDLKPSVALDPPFTPLWTEYYAPVPYDVTMVRVIATPLHCHMQTLFEHRLGPTQ